MAIDGLEVRKSLTFEQAERVEPLPTQPKLKELSPAFRAAAWDLILGSIEHYKVSGGFGFIVTDA
jgi:hypothetical protein